MSRVIVDAARMRTDYESRAVREFGGNRIHRAEFPVDFVQVTSIEHEFAADVSEISPEASTRECVRWWRCRVSERLLLGVARVDRRLCSGHRY